MNRAIEVECPDCEATRIIDKYNLSRMKSLSCRECYLKSVRGKSRKDLSGKKFGRLTVISFNNIRGKQRRAYWNCLCECGTELVVRSDNFQGGGTISCGCYNKEIVSKYFFKDRTNIRYGRLVALEMTGEKTSSGCHYWRCVCDCKNEICVPGNNLEIGHTRSCGCLHREITSARRGELHPGWKSSRSQKDRLYRRQYPEYYAWRNRIFERDSFICRVCGISRSDQMVAHHLYSYAKYKDLQLNVNNGITLCSDCHNGFHEWHGGITQACTKGDFSNWLIANGYTTVDIMVTDVAP